ncbi:MAG: carbohydrate kinase family protein [Thiobacillaceae bacterium]
MRTLICGSLAFDSIMVFHDHFKHHILPDKIHILNVSFLVPDMRREYGGCAGNIAYNLKLLGGEPVIMATVGDDFAPYRERLESLGLSQECVRQVGGSFTAQAFITTDMSDNQITAFHPGAMNQSHLNDAGSANDIRLGIVSPDGREGMLRHCEQFHHANIPFVFDPGQGMPLFNGDELMQMVRQAHYVTLNDYEAELLQTRTGQTLQQLAGEVKCLIVTKGGEGSQFYVDGRAIEIPTAPVREIVDPTGCGDAFRAGLLYGIVNGMDWETTGRLASLMGAIKIESRGGQNHAPSRLEIETRFVESFDYRI